MGGGSWTTTSFVNYSTSRGRTATIDGLLDGDYTAQDLYTSHSLQPELNPYNVVRECCDSEEHPNSIPVILALDVTGSMGGALVEVAKKLNEVMTSLYEKVEDVEIMVMGIGDLAYDYAPIQASQFESDIRIAEQLDKIWFERGGGGNGFESYTAAWYFGLKHTELDCWKRGKKGIIITIGDEPLNPYLPAKQLERALGDTLEGNVETEKIYEAACTKFDIYHLAVDSRENSYRYYASSIDNTWGKTLDNKHFRVVTLDEIVPQIVNIVSGSDEKVQENNSQEIKW